jgi:hypothetical protein
MPGLHVRHQRHPAPAQDQEVRDMPALPAVHPGRQQERLDEHRLRAAVEIRDRWADWDRAPFTGKSARHVSVYAKTLAA